MPLVVQEIVSEWATLVGTQSSCWGRRSRLLGYKGELLFGSQMDLNV